MIIILILMIIVAIYVIIGGLISGIVMAVYDEMDKYYDEIEIQLFCCLAWPAAFFMLIALFMSKVGYFVFKSMFKKKEKKEEDK